MLSFRFMIGDRYELTMPDGEVVKLACTRRFGSNQPVLSIEASRDIDVRRIPQPRDEPEKKTPSLRTHLNRSKS